VTEKEWLECTNPAKMLDYLQDKASDRKLRLFILACCYRVQDLIPEERIRHVPESFADVQPTEMDLWFFRKGMQTDVTMPSSGSPPAAPDPVRSSLAAANISWATARIVTRASGGKVFDSIYSLPR
jgi:hypothetical protein